VSSWIVLLRAEKRSTKPHERTQKSDIKKERFMSDNTPKQTLEIGTEFEGVLRSEAPVVVSGQLKGEVNAPALTLTDDGSVFGRVKVQQLKSSGSLGGEIDAESVELSGSVSDNTVIRSASLEVKLEEAGGDKLQVTFGNCELHIGDPTKTRAQPYTENKNNDFVVPVSVN
jgi:cytoskeletal protein CcmA (bactofilin family)